MNKFIDLTGKKFGRLKVIERADNYISPKGTAVPRWKCECECGKIKVINGISLKSGMTKSCGCLRNERVLEGKAKSKGQKIKIKGNDIREQEGIVFFKLSGSEKEMICDKEDSYLLKGHTWRLNEKGYAKSTTKQYGKRKVLLAHRLIINAKEGEIVDHINRNRLDNRKENLRIVDINASSINRKLKDGNKSGYAGVYKQKKSWVACITKDGKWSIIGHYKTYDEAVIARRKAEMEIYGIYSQEK